jgi:chaperonin GroES
LISVQEKRQQGEVIAVGSPGGRGDSGKLIPIDIKAGDRGLFGKYSGTEVKIIGLDAPAAPSSQTMVGQGCQEATHGHWG